MWINKCDNSWYSHEIWAETENIITTFLYKLFDQFDFKSNYGEKPVSYYLEHKNLDIQHTLSFSFSNDIFNINNFGGISKICQETVHHYTEVLF